VNPVERFGNFLGQGNRTDGPKVSAGEQGGGHKRRVFEAVQAKGQGSHAGGPDSDEGEDVRRAAHAE